VGKYGTNLEGFGAFEGGVNADKGAPLVSTSSDGETAFIFGSAALRTIQAGVENGDFAIPPDDASATITAENPLPYWTFTDVNSAGAITCAIVNDPGAASTNVLRFTVNSGTLTGKSATLTRYIPVASSASRSFSFYAEASFDNATSSGQATAQLTCQFYQADQTTTTGTAFNSDAAAFSALTTPTGLTAPNVFAVSPSLVNTTAPADAAFLKLTITVATIATQSADRTVDLTEVRVGNGLPEFILTDKSTPTNPPAYIINDSGTLTLGDGGNLGALDIGNDSVLNGTDSVSLSAADISLTATTVSAIGNLTATGNLTVTGTIIGDGVTTDLKHGITLQRTTNLTVNTSVDASATAITWSSAVKNTSLYAYWSSGSTIAIPLTGWYSITCHLISGTGLGTGFAFRLYALVNGTVIAESETEAGANTTSDTFSISTIAYMTATDSLVFRASASAASKTIGGSRRSACSIVYLGNTSA
jgi:phage baseplate assembly protein gpV